MKTTLKIIFALMLAAWQTLPTLATGADKDLNALLWQISGKGLKKPSYLYGTLHAICPEQMVIPQVLRDKVGQTEQLTLELDMDDPNMMGQFMASAKLPKGQSLKALFSEAQYRLLAAYFAENFSVDLKYLDNMKPFILQTMILSKLTGCTPESYEQRLMDIAHSNKHEVIGLETVQQQMSAVDQLPDSMYADMLVRMVSDIPQAKTDYRRLVDLYLAQDLTGLESLMKQNYTPEQYLKFKEVFLSQRNKAWIPVIEQMANAKPTFFAVGAAHLPGEDGVIALLRKQGFKVTPVIK
ncbi:TraB/GumN family protein [Pontibacter oryzae]|uniref:TraB/GumN family protein n=1 Tax=Pontibacter oryzae TaxID=2304593 RepID=A0A399S3R2_9BACT|nr:TraB/GumN family protein [Pontibacter oryzae]RIJ36702.1 TraB/GumN family protein [Pontibacter oryzae]